MMFISAQVSVAYENERLWRESTLNLQHKQGSVSFEANAPDHHKAHVEVILWS